MKVRNGFDGTGRIDQTELEYFDKERAENEQVNETEIKESPFGVFKKDLAEFLDTSTTHGLPRIANANCWISRITWVIIVICLVSYLTLAVYKLYLQLISDKINVIVQTKTASALTLPMITVCDGIPYLKSLETHTNSTGAQIRTLVHAENQHMQRLLNKENIRNETLYNFILKDQAGGMPLCQFSGEQCIFNKHVKGGLPILHKGQCYTFNQDGSFKQIIKGPTMGIFAVFYLADDANTTRSTGATSTHGIEIFIQKPDEKNPTGSDGILGIPGHLTRISLRQKTYKRLPEPYPDRCVDNKNTESPHECQIKCIAMHQIKECKVISVTIKHYFNDMNAKNLGNMSLERIPETDEEHACIKMVVESFANEHLSCKCYMPCFERVFDYSISQSRWPHDNTRDDILLLIRSQFGINITENESNKQLAAIQVYYAQLQYDEILQLPAYSVDKFLSDLGGLLGLFIGASVFSVIDFLVFLLRTLVIQAKILLNQVILPRLRKKTCKKSVTQ